MTKTAEEVNKAVQERLSALPSVLELVLETIRRLKLVTHKCVPSLACGALGPIGVIAIRLAVVVSK